MDEKSTDGPTWRSRVEMASKVLVGLVGLAYILGLLILNLHVREFGVYYLSFLQIEYVFAGTVWLFLTGVTYCWLAAIIHRITRIPLSRKFLDVVYLILIVVGGFANLILILEILHEGEGRVIYTRHWSTVGALFMQCAAVWNIAYKTRWLKGKFSSRDANPTDPLSFSWPTFDLLFYVITLVVALSFYSTIVFPKISPTFGGGQPQKAQFLIKADRKSVVEALGFQVPNDLILGPQDVVFESPSFFLIRPPREFPNANVKAIRLHKDLIDAAFHLKLPD